MNLGEALTFVVHRAGPVSWEKGQLCKVCGKELPVSYTGSWPEGSFVAMGAWIGATPYVIRDRELAADEKACKK